MGETWAVMVRNRKKILDAIKQAGGIKGAFEILSPDDIGTDKFSSFKQYALMLAEVDKAVESEKLGNVRESEVDMEIPKQFGGWGVQYREPYYRLFKRVGGKLRWIHLGRAWDAEIALSKIQGMTP
jgi:hypothetical protein